jgi:hypothetical protein
LGKKLNGQRPVARIIRNMARQRVPDRRRKKKFKVQGSIKKVQGTRFKVQVENTKYSYHEWQDNHKPYMGVKKRSGMTRDRDKEIIEEMRKCGDYNRENICTALKLCLPGLCIFTGSGPPPFPPVKVAETGDYCGSELPVEGR